MASVERFMVFFVLPTILGLALIEGLVLWRVKQYDWRACGVSMANVLARIVITLVLPLSIVTPVINWAYQHRLATIELNGWLVVLLLFIGQEFCYYWFHRASHEIRWFWCNHAVHHTPNELNLAAGLRIGLFGKLIGTRIFYIPLIWFGFSPSSVFATLSLNLLYQVWIHATWIPKLGWLEGIFNTPSAHRVHHAANLEYLDANYGGVLVVFDRMFGTYIPEREDLPCRYGLVHPVTSYNPLRVEFAEWMALTRDLAKARSIREVIGYLFMPPGWAPNGEGSTTAALRAREQSAGISGV